MLPAQAGLAGPRLKCTGLQTIHRQLAATYLDWGIPTADSILNVRKATPGIIIFASGGLKDGLDITKCISLGATLGAWPANS